MKRGKSRATEEDVVVQSAAVLAHAVRDGMETLVQGISRTFRTPANTEVETRLSRIEKALQEMKQVQMEMKQAQEVAEEAVKDRHEALLALLARKRRVLRVKYI